MVSKPENLVYSKPPWRYFFLTFIVVFVLFQILHFNWKKCIYVNSFEFYEKTMKNLILYRWKKAPKSFCFILLELRHGSFFLNVILFKAQKAQDSLYIVTFLLICDFWAMPLRVLTCLFSWLLALLVIGTLYISQTESSSSCPGKVRLV